MKNSTRNTNITLALLTGMAVGGVVSLLFAPDSGKKTRSKIRKGSNQAADALSRAAIELKGKAQDTYLDKKATLEARLDHMVSDLRHNTQDIVPIMESKLKEMKARGKKTKKKINAS